MRLVRDAALLGFTILLAACGSDRPTAPLAREGPLSSLTMSVDGCVDKSLVFAAVDVEVRRLINGLFTGDNLQSSLAMWENLKKDKLESRPLQSHVDNEAKFTLGQLGIGGIQDPDGAGGLTAATGSIRLLDLIFRCAGATPTSIPDPPAGFDAAFELVQAISTPQQFNTSFGDAAAYVPGDALASDVLLVLVRQPEDVQVNSPFPKLSRTVDVAIAGGRLNAGQGVSVLLCPFVGISEETSQRGVVAHQRRGFQPGDPVGTNVEYLAPPEGGTLVCPDDVASAWRMEKGFLRQRASQLASVAQKVWNFFAPKPLYAGHAAIGGILTAADDEFGGFSPVVLVDPYVGTAITNITIPTTTYGEPVPITATLRVTSGPAAWIGQPVTQSLEGMPTLTLSALEVTATLSDGKVQTADLDAAGQVHFSFTQVNAGDHTAQLNFPETLNPGNAPLFGASTGSRGFHVNQAPLDVTPTAASRSYGDANPTLAGDITGEVYDQDNAFVATYATTATPESYVTTESRSYSITVVSIAPAPGSTALLSNYVYDLGEHTAPLTITPRALNGSAAGASRVYGETNPAFSGTIANPVSFADGLVVSYVNSSVATTAVGPSGSPAPAEYAINAVLSGPPVENYVNGIIPGTLTITQRVLTGGPTPDAASAMYGEPVPASFPFSLLATVNGAPAPALVAGDGVSASFTTTAIQGSYVASYPIALQLSGAAASNYDVSGVAAGVFSISSRPLTVTPDDASKLTGEANPAFTGVVENRYAGDALVINYGTTATTSSPAGTYPITVSVTGAAAGSYAAVLGEGTLTVTDPGQVLYGVESGTDGLSIINPATGASTFVGRMDPDITKFTTPVAMTAEASTGTLFVWNNSDGNSNETLVHTGVLLTVNKCTGRATQISTANSGVVAQSLAIAPDGQLYLLADNLYRVDRVTGALTTVGPLSISAYGADFDPATGILYALTGSTLYTINTATGAATAVATLSQNMGVIGSLVFMPSGTLMGASINPGQLYDVDKATGAISNVRSTAGTQGLGFAPACSS
jgi:hypothetical protein